MKILNFLFKIFKFTISSIILIIGAAFFFGVALLMYHTARENLIPMIKTDWLPLLITGTIMCSFFALMVFGIPWALQNVSDLFRRKND